MLNAYKKTRVATFALAVAVMLCVTIEAHGQDPSQAQKDICAKYREADRCGDLVTEFSGPKNLIATKGVSSLVDNPLLNTDAFSSRIYLQAAKAQFQARVAALEQSEKARVLQMISTSSAVNQTGASPTASGTTSLVKLPTTTDLISLAAESGAFTDTANGTTTTIQGNALGISKYLDQIGKNQGAFFEEHGKAANALQPWNFTVTLNVAQSSSTTTTTSPSANSSTPFSIPSIVLPSNNASLSSFSTSYAIYKKVDANDKTFQKNWTTAIASPALKTTESNLYLAFVKLVDTAKLSTDPMTDATVKTAFMAWHRDGLAAETKQTAESFEDFVVAYAAYDDALGTYILKQTGAPAAVLALDAATQLYESAIYTAFNDSRGKPLATAEYTYATPALKPATHEGTIALSYLFKGKFDSNDPKVRNFWTGDQLTGNFTASWYASLPAGATYGRFRDTQLSMEFDKPFGGTVDAPVATWSLAGYGQYQYDPTVLNITAGNLAPGTNITLPSNAQVLLGTSGWTGVVQGKLVINLKQGVTIPLAIKYSNRTDLLSNSNDVRGQIGISYDLSALSSLLPGSK